MRGRSNIFGPEPQRADGAPLLTHNHVMLLHALLDRPDATVPSYEAWISAAMVYARFTGLHSGDSGLRRAVRTLNATWATRFRIGSRLMVRLTDRGRAILDRTVPAHVRGYGPYRGLQTIHDRALVGIEGDMDRVVRAWRAGRPDTSALQRLTNAFRDDWHSRARFEDAIADALAPDVVANAYSAIDDDDVRYMLEMNDDATVSDAERVRYFEEHVLPRLLEDADISHAFSPVPITARDGTTAVLFVDVQGYSFSGIRERWHGPFASGDAFERSLLAAGWLIGSDPLSGLSLQRKLERLRGTRR